MTRLQRFDWWLTTRFLRVVLTVSTALLTLAVVDPSWIRFAVWFGGVAAVTAFAAVVSILADMQRETAVPVDDEEEVYQ